MMCNYRPIYITLLPVSFFKIHHFDQLTAYLESNNHLVGRQCGLRKNKSTKNYWHSLICWMIAFAMTRWIQVRQYWAVIMLIRQWRSIALIRPFSFENWSRYGRSLDTTLIITRHPKESIETLEIEFFMKINNLTQFSLSTISWTEPLYCQTTFMKK